MNRLEEIVASELQQISIVRSTDIGVPMPDPTNNMSDPMPPCIACGRVHASAKDAMRCLEAEVVRLRIENKPMAELRSEVERLRSDPIHSIREAVAKLPTGRHMWPERARK